MIGQHNAVPGCPGWYFGLVVTDKDSATFDLFHDDGHAIAGVRASRYRTDAAARLMGAELPSQEAAARSAVAAFAPKEVNG